MRFFATYYDAWSRQPERLALELDTRRDAPQAIALNYAGFNRSGGAYHFVVEEADEPLTIRTRMIVDATGAWIDETIGALDNAIKTNEPTVTGTKGSHIILANQSLYQALNGHMIFFERRLLWAGRLAR
ncbi:hypothetical protein [Agrobacterium cavarae]|uniref:hypothetical protein n=1 Tax=Agrobacterium cavarae TaxID=2528239 RepID=UPI0035E3BE58